MDRKWLSDRKHVGLIALALCWSCHSSAETTDLFDLSLEELGNVIITGSTLTEKKLRDVPSAVTVLTRDEIHKLPVSTVEELVNFVPGFQSYRSSDFGNLPVMSIRGRRTGYTNREMLILLNGMRIDEYFSGGSTLVFANIPLANLARVEFMRGPGSAVYGSGAYTGVINLITDDHARQLDIGIGDEQRLQTSWQHASSTSTPDGIRFSTLLHAVSDEGYPYSVPDSFSDGRVDTRDGYETFHGQLQLWLSRDTRLQLALAQNKADEFYIGGTVDDAFNRHDHTFAGLMLEKGLHWHDAIRSELLGGFQIMDIDSGFHPVSAIDIGQISTPTSTDPLLLTTYVKTQEWWLRWQNDWRIGHADSLQFGLEYRNPSSLEAESASNYDIVQLAQGGPVINYYGDFSHTAALAETSQRDIVGIYLQQQHDWSEQAATIVGVRYDQYSQVGNATSPRLGLILHPTTSDSVKLLWGRAFRAPQADELYTANNPLLQGNPDLKPETVDTYEVIWLHKWQRVQISANYFYNRFDDAIRTVVVNSGRTYQNSSESETSQGLTFELTGAVFEHFTTRVAATRLLDTPDAFFREARQWLAIAGTYTRPQGYGSLTLQYQGERENLLSSADERETLDDYVVVNARLGWTPRNDLETYLDLRNLTDTESSVPSNSGDIDGGVPNRGREIRVGMIVRY